MVILVIAAALRVGWVLSRPTDEATLALLPDQLQYLTLAQNLLAGDGYAFVDPRFAAGPEGGVVRAFRMPGYPLLVAALGANVTAVRLVQALLDVATVAGAYMLARSLPGGPGRRPGLLAAAIVACNPFLIYFTGLLLSETLFACLLTWSLVLLLRRWWWGVLLAAACVYAKPSAVLLPVAMGLAAACGGGRAALAGGRAWVVRPAAGLGLTLLLLTPWAVRNLVVLDAWVWTTTNTGLTLYDGLHPAATGASDQTFVNAMPQLLSMNEVARDTYLSEQAKAFVQAQPGQAARLAAAKLLRTWSPVPLSDAYGSRAYAAVAAGYAVPLYVLALAGLVRRGARYGKLVLLLPAVYLTLVHAATVGSLRYRVPAEPALAVLAAAALVQPRKGETA